MSSHMFAIHSGSSPGDCGGPSLIPGTSEAGSTGVEEEHCSVPEADERVFMAARVPPKGRAVIDGTYWGYG